MKDRLGRFWDQQAIWSQATFGKDEDRGPIGAIKHLRKEADELLQDPSDLEEYADCIFLVFDACRRARFDYTDLVSKCFEKLEKNRARVWPKTAPDEPAEHDRRGE